MSSNIIDRTNMEGIDMNLRLCSKKKKKKGLDGWYFFSLFCFVLPVPLVWCAQLCVFLFCQGVKNKSLGFWLKKIGLVR